MEQNQSKEETYVNCKICGQEMCPGNGCTLTSVSRNGNQYLRFPAGSKQDLLPDMREDQFCHDCNAAKGQYHHLGCDMERCPVCNDQLFICGCFDLEAHVM